MTSSDWTGAGELTEPAAAVAPSLPRPGRGPTAVLPAVGVGIASAVAVALAGAVLVRDAAVRLGWVGGTEWIRGLIDRIDGLQFHWPMAPVAAVLGIVGIWLVGCGLRPRRPTAAAVAGAASIWLPHRHIGRLVSHAAGSVPGVRGVRCKVGRRKIVVAVTAEFDDPTSVQQLRNAVSDAAAGAVRILSKPPRITVQLTETKSGDRR